MQELIMKSCQALTISFLSTKAVCRMLLFFFAELIAVSWSRFLKPTQSDKKKAWFRAAFRVRSSSNITQSRTWRWHVKSLTILKRKKGLYFIARHLLLTSQIVINPHLLICFSYLRNFSLVIETGNHSVEWWWVHRCQYAMQNISQ